MGGGAGNGAEALGVQRQSSSAPAVPSFLDTSSPSGQYTAGLIRRESNGVASAKNPNSSATGLGQFTTGTWKAVAAAHPELVSPLTGAPTRSSLFVRSRRTR